MCFRGRNGRLQVWLDALEASNYSRLPVKQTEMQHKSARTGKRLVLILLAACLCAAVAWGVYRKQRGGPAGRGSSAEAVDSGLISAVVTDEETCLTLGSRMAALSKGLLDLKLPAPGAEGVFAPSVTVSDV